MEYTVLLESMNGRYLARVPVLPECVGEGYTREEALRDVQETIADKLRRVEITHVTVDTPGYPDPWEPFIGMWENDSTWDEFQSEIAAYRRHPDEEPVGE